MLCRKAEERIFEELQPLYAKNVRLVDTALQIYLRNVLDQDINIRYPLGENADLGFTIKKDQDIVIFTNSSIRLSREIFTLAHELGHAVLHMEADSSFIDDSITIADRSTDEREQEANYFAACL